MNSRKRQQRWRRLLRWPLVILAMLWLGGTWLIRTDAFLDHVTSAIERLIEQRLGEDVVIGELNIKPMRGVVTARGVLISHQSEDPEHDGRTIAAVDRLVLRLGFTGWRPGLTQIDLYHPVLKLHVDDDGLREFRDMVRSETPAASFPWRGMVVKDGAVSVTGDALDVSLEDITIEQWEGLTDLRIDRLELDAAGISQTARSIVLSEVSLAPGRVFIPDLNLPLTDVLIEGAVAVQPDGGLRGELSLVGDLAMLDPLLRPRGTVLEGTAWLDVSLAGTTAEPKLEGALAVEDGVVDRVSVGRRFPLGDPLTVGWRLAENQLLFEPITARWGGGLVEISGAVDLQSTGIWLSLSGEGLSLREVCRDTDASDDPWVEMDADLEAQLAGTLRPLNLAGSVKIAAVNLKAAAGPVRTEPTILHIPLLTAITQLRVDSDQLFLDIRQLDTARSSAAGTAWFRYPRPGDSGDIDIRLDFPAFSLSDLRPLNDLDLQGHGPASVWLHGVFGALSAEADVDLQDFSFVGLPLADQISGTILSPGLTSLHFPGFTGTRGETGYSGQLEVGFGEETGIDLQLLIPEGRLSDLTGVVLDLPEIEGDVEGTLSLSGPSDALDGEIRLAMEEVELYGEYFPKGEAVAWMEDGLFTLEHMELRRPRARGEESLYARGSIGRGYATNLEIIAGGIRLEQLDNLIRREVPLSGDVLLDVHVGGTLMEPEPSGRLALRNTWLAARSLDETTVRFVTEDGIMQVEGGIAGNRLGLEGWIELWEAQRYALVASLDDFPMHVLYSEAPDGSPVRAIVGGEIAVSGAAAQPVSIDATISSASLSWGTHALRSEEPWRFTQSGRVFSLEGVSLTGGQTALAIAGGRSDSGAVRFEGGGVLDLDLLRLVVPDLTTAEGVADLTVTIDGVSGDLQPLVEATLSDASLEGDWFPHPIESIDGRVSAAPDGYDIAAMTGRLGGGELVMSGRIDAEDWRPTRYDISGDLAAARVRYLDFLPPITGDATLTVSGPANDLLMSGDIAVHEMVFADRIDWESWVLELSEERLVGAVSEETNDLFSMDIEVTAEDTIRMRNNVADLTAGGKLTIIGDTSRPGVIGFIRSVPGGRVLLKERNFELLRGELNFIEPFSFDPDVDISMNTTISTRDRDVSVDYQVLGRYSDWYTQTSSDPPLAQADINALLLFGMTREELERYGGLSSALLIESGDLFASKLGLVERVGEGIFQYDIFRLDRVDLVSGVSERGLAVTSELRLLAEKDIGEGTRVTLEQNLNRVDDTYLSLEQRLARRLYLRGYWATEQEGRYMEIGGAYGVDFNLRWELN